MSTTLKQESRAIAFTLVWLLAIILGFILLNNGCSLFGTAERKDLEDFTSKLLQCEEVGREAGSYEAYEACKKDAGLE